MNKEETDLKITLVNSLEASSLMFHNEIVDFLYAHLDQYGDEKKDILKAVEYALSSFPHQGGFVLLAREENEIVGAVVMNKTGMEGYIPENILVYIAVHGGHRGKGIGKALMKEAIQMAKGDVALHVEPDNPARHLYENIGFTSKYMEMRYKNK